MAFNLRISGLLKFKKTLNYIKNGQYSSAAKEMLKSKWAKQVGIRAYDLSIMMEKDIPLDDLYQTIERCYTEE